MGFGLLAGVLVVAQAALLASAVDAAFLRQASVRQLVPLLALFTLLAVGRAVAVSFQDVRGRRFSSAVRLCLRDRVVRRVLAGGPVPLAAERTGELIQTLVGGIEALDAWLAQYVPQRPLAVLVPALVLVAAAWTDPLSGLVLLLTGPLVPLFAWLVATSAHARAERQWGRLQVLAARFFEAVQGLETLRAAGRLGSEHRRIEEASEAYRLTTMDLLRLAFVSALVLELVGTLGTAVVAVELGLRLLRGRVAFGDALFVLLLTPEFYRPMRALGAAFHAALSGQEAARRVLDLLKSSSIPGPQHAPPHSAVTAGVDEATRADRKAGTGSATSGPDVVVRRGSATGGSTPVAPTIVFDQVHFAYESEAPAALDGFSLTIGSGETVALVGPSGAGKSTAANLLLRFVEPGSGRLLVDERTLSAQPPEMWRRRIAWVPQRPHLFQGTLGDNLRWASPGASAAEIDETLDAVGLLDWVRRLPLGYATPLGERGERLSGGEAQRVAVARALLRKDADVLILDEPTAHLDPHNENVLVSAFGRLRRGRSALLIAHRLTTALAADRVAVVVGGRIVECGAPSKLAEERGLFAGLVAAWRGAA